MPPTLRSIDTILCLCVVLSGINGRFDGGGSFNNQLRLFALCTIRSHPHPPFLLNIHHTAIDKHNHTNEIKMIWWLCLTFISLSPSLLLISHHFRWMLLELVCWDMTWLNIVYSLWNAKSTFGLTTRRRCRWCWLLFILLLLLIIIIIIMWWLKGQKFMNERELNFGRALERFWGKNDGAWAQHNGWNLSRETWNYALRNSWI